VEAKSLGGRVKSFFRQYVVTGQPYSNDWNTDRAVREGFEVNPWIYRAVHVIASAAVARTIQLRQGDPVDGVPIKKVADPTRLLHVFNVQSNPWERAKVFRYRLIAQWLLSSRGVYIEVVRTRAGRIGMLNLLDPDLVEIIPTREVLPDGTEAIDPIGAFRVTVNDGTGPYNTLPRYNPGATFAQQTNSVLWVRSPHPTLMFRGMTPMQAAAMSADMDRAARGYNRRFMDNDGRPGGILMVKGTVQDNALEILEARFNGGPSSAGRTSAVQGDAMEWVDTSGNPRDTQWSESMDRMLKEVSMTFGTPTSVLGDSSGRTFDNADAEFEIWWSTTMSDMLGMLDDQLDILTGSYDDMLYLRHDLSDVWVLGRHKREMIKTAGEDFAAGLITLDEYRIIAGMPPLNIPASRVVFLPSGKIAAGQNDDDVAEVAKLPMIGSPQPADVGAEAQRGAMIGSQAGARLAGDINNARSLRVVGPSRAPAALERRDALAVEPDWEGKESRARPEPVTALWQ
jgi:HK97 family phage portal protein